MLKRFGRLGILVFLALWAVPAFAAGEVFTVRGVAVDATAAGAAEARDIALAEGQRQAFDRLMHRLTRQQDWAALPNPPASQLADLVLGVEVAEERASSTRYIAKVTYTFKQASIRRLLRQAGVPFSEARSKASLLLAVLETPAGTVLWEDPNPWRKAWSDRELADELVPILVPLNDIADSGLLASSAASTAQWSDVSAIAEKYGLENVIVAHAKVDGEPGQGDLKVTLTRLSAARTTATQFDFTGGGEPDVQMAKAVDSALSRLYEEWKAATIIVFGQENVLTAAIWFDSVGEWMQIRRRLEEAPTVTGIDVLGFSPQGAEVRLHYAGTQEQLRITLEQSSVLISNSAGFWEIALAERGLRSVSPEPEPTQMDPVADAYAPPNYVPSGL